MAKEQVAPSIYFPSSPLIDDAEWHTIEHEEGLKQAEATDFSLLPMCERPHFESMVGAFIGLNALFMALQLDLADQAEPKWPFLMVDWMFCGVFASEIAFRLYCLGFCNYFKQKKYLFDTLLVSLNIVDSAIQLTGSESTGLQAFSALRILRIFKIVKMLRIVRIIEDLHLIVIGLISALKSLQWVALMLGLVVFIMAVVLKMLVGKECGSADFQQSFIYHFGSASEAEATEKCNEYWGTVLRSMYTLYQVTTLESWSQVIARPIWDIRPSYVILILGFQLLTTFGLLNIVVAAVVDGTMNSSDEFVVERKVIKQTVSHLEIVRSIYEQTVGTDGKVTAATFVPLLATAPVRRKLLTMDISYDDPSQVFRIIDAEGTGAISLKAMAEGFMRMRGSAKSKDLLAVRALVYRCHHEIVQEVREIKQLESNVDILARDLREDFRQMLAEERKQNRKQDQISDLMLVNGNVGTMLGTPSAGSPDICDQVARISSRIDRLLSSFASSSCLPPSAKLELNVSVQSSMDMPSSVTNSMQSAITNGVTNPLQVEHSKQLHQLQQEFQTLERWLDLVPKGLQAQGASKQMQNCFKGDRPPLYGGEEPGLETDVSSRPPLPGLRGMGNENSQQRPLQPLLCTPASPPGTKK